MTNSTKTALITGASSGIGRELAYEHAKRGGDLIVVARSEQALRELKSELEKKFKVRVLIVVQDLAQKNASKIIAQQVSESGMSVDYLINNAGFGGVGEFRKRKLEDDLAMIAVNITALTALTHHFIPILAQNSEARILNVSSTAALVPGPMQAVYYATKDYVRSFSNALSKELEATSIKVTNLMPGATKTSFGQRSGMSKTALFNKTASARDVAQRGYEAMLAGKREVVAGVGFFQRIALALTPLLPQKILLDQVYRLQQIKEQ
jgi:short-subunit dehydrogenase